MFLFTARLYCTCPEWFCQRRRTATLSYGCLNSRRGSSSASMTIAITNLAAPLGAQVSGVDLAKPLTQGDVDAIAQAWRTRLVIVVHGQTLSDPQLLAF